MALSRVPLRQMVVRTMIRAWFRARWDYLILEYEIARREEGPIYTTEPARTAWSDYRYGNTTPDP
jgi:hypothetical protein